MIPAIRIRGHSLELLDQRFLPHKEIWNIYSTHEEVAVAIENMVVRGAPAIGCAAAYGLALAADEGLDKNFKHPDFNIWIKKARQRLANTRPTAVNLFHALNEAESSILNETNLSNVTTTAWAVAEKIYNDDLETCRKIGENGASTIKGSNLSIMTHCNAGGIATTGFGTALGVIQTLFDNDRIQKVYVNETRPWLQGSRLTAWELVKSGIPCQLSIDSAAAMIMAQGKVDAVVVGADRIAMNGDTANKIGTYSLAVAASYHKIPFYIAAPLSTFDPKSQTREDIPIETRPTEEITHIQSKSIAASEVAVYNPSFDITPYNLITGYLTERGLHNSHEISSLFGKNQHTYIERNSHVTMT